MDFFHCSEDRSAPNRPLSLSLVERPIKISVFAGGNGISGHSGKDMSLADLELKVYRFEAGC